MKNFVHSDNDCCLKCRNLIYDIERGNFCKSHNKPVQPYNPACEQLKRIFQGFGE